MLDIKILLPELKKLVTDVSEDLLARSTAKNDPYSAKVDVGLREAYTQIEKGGRTADAFEVWREDYLDQVAVAWVLGCVFVRFMEDNHLIDECWLAGDGEHRKLAEDTHELYFRAHPHESDREYFEHVFHEVGKIPACRDLFAEGKTPLWAVGPSGDAAMKLLAFWRDVIPETGELRRSFEVEDGDTRFLGDLYQDLSDAAQKKYALKQTPVFVEEFILDRTLNPAIDEFGLDEVRMIDPTCGSGHFLLGSFARLFDLWIKREDNEVVAAQKALDGVWGVDINPFAVAIARFRLIVAALRACGIKRLKDAPAWNIHLATGDSLLFGCRWDREGKKKGEQQFLGTPEERWAPEIYACEDKEAVSEVLGQQYHAVVGNPPYINAKDSRLNQAYRDRFKSCAGRYSLGVPFTERFFDLAISTQTSSGFVGLITTNSFMKRAFGKTLIRDFLPTVDLSHLIDSAGAYIPGHGTPTVIIFGRHRPPVGDTVRCVLGIKGEPKTPADPAKGRVWKSIVSQIDIANAQDDFTSTADVPRTMLKKHPWSLAGGGATELKELLDRAGKQRLSDIANIGVCLVTLEDEAYRITPGAVERNRFPTKYIRPMVIGDNVRDWTITGTEPALFPYNPDTLKPESCQPMEKWFWPLRTTLSYRLWFKKTQIMRGLKWFEYGHVSKEKFKTNLSLVFAEIASHNHFFLKEDRSLFDRTAPVVKPSIEMSRQEIMQLLGFLNSSIVCFWMKQVSHQKQMTGGDGVRIEARSRVPYQFASRGLKPLPIPDGFGTSRTWVRLGSLAEQLHLDAAELEMLDATSLLSDVADITTSSLNDAWTERSRLQAEIRSRMVVVQDELDYLAYQLFGIVNDDLVADEIEVPKDIKPGQRAFEIRQGESEDDYEVPPEIPSDWPETVRSLWQRRIVAINSSRELRLLEDAHYKRRWIGRQGLFNHTKRKDDLQKACREWLLNRLEAPELWQSDDPHLASISEISDWVASDKQFRTIGSVYRGRDDFDLGALVTELVESECVPNLPRMIFKATGLRKWDRWTGVWKTQRESQSGIGDNAPEKFTAADYLDSNFKRLRGSLGTHLERWISFPHCETESDSSLVVGWAGWNHLQQATALIAYYDARKREGWDAKRLTPLLAGLDQLLPWIHQWHPEVDPEFGETAGQSFETMLKADAHELGLTLEDIRAWEPPAKTMTRRKRTTK